jgi:3-isopropylmalate dehydrogenase
MILSMSMLLKYSLCMPDEAKAIDQAVENVIERGVKTGDIGGSNSTVEVGDAVAEELGKILRARS